MIKKIKITKKVRLISKLYLQEMFYKLIIVIILRLEIGITDLRSNSEKLQNDCNNEVSESYWWSKFITNEDIENYKQGPKLVLLFAILRACETIGDKVLVLIYNFYARSVFLCFFIVFISNNC